MDLAILEAEKTVKRFFDKQDRTALREGQGATLAGRSICQRYLGALAKTVPEKIKAVPRGKGERGGLVPLLVQLSPDVIALAGLQTILHSVGIQDTFRGSILALGAALEGECWAAGLTRTLGVRKAHKLTLVAKRRNSSLAYRRKAARAMAAQAGYKAKRWGPKLLAIAGGWLLEVITTALPDLFEVITETRISASGPQTEKFLALSKGAEEQAQKAVEEAILRNPVFLPMDSPPIPWTGFNEGGPKDQRAAYAAQVVRTPYKDVKAQIKYAIKTGQMAPAIEGLNVLQAVPWRINTRVLGVIRECVARGIDVPGLPGADVPMPAKDRPWDSLDEGERRWWRMRADKTKQKNRALLSDRLSLTEDLQTAELFSTLDRFYTPMNMDWRGRVYAMCQFNFQREDRVRALFEFADGEPIGEEGLWWLKVHVANCGDFDKISKRPLQERVEWVNNNLTMIADVASAPLRNLYWLKADKPFLFIAASIELVAAMAIGSSYITRLPVSFDGSCSGLQHLCAMTRAPEGSLVNLTPMPLPQDVYSTVASCVNTRIASDAIASDWDEDTAWRGEVARLALAYGIDRKVTKRNVMTYAYSSKKFGMAAQQQEDLMAPLEEDVLTGKRDEHPFTFYAEGCVDYPSSAARYLASHIYEAIEEVINLPAKALAMLQRCAKALAHEAKPVRWVTPTGLPWINRYHAPVVECITLWMSDCGVGSRHRMNIAVGDMATIDKDKAAAGISPNFVHALDAAHLALVVGAAAKENITALATVHDSFGCLAPQARRFNEIIREQFVEMYATHDVLNEVLGAAKHDLTQANWDKLPTVPQYGGLDLTKVKEAAFAFA